MRAPISVLSVMAIACATLCAALAGATAAAEPVASANATAVLHLGGRTELPTYSGDFDHFAADLKGNRLFLAGEDQGTLEVFDLRSGAHLKTVKGFEQPHGILYLPDVNRLIVTDSGTGMTKLVDATSYRVIGSIPLTVGADSMQYDPSRRHLYVVTGGKNADPKMSRTIVAELDPRSGRHIGDMSFDTDFTESIAAEQKGHRLFINLTGKSMLAVIDKESRRVIDTWPVKGAQMNAAMAFDETHQRLFVGTRKPFKLLVLDARNGATLASFDAPERTNQVIFDKANQRIYMAGDDYLGVIEQKDANHYEELAHVPTAKGAKTAILVPELNRLYVAVSPGDSKGGGALLRFDVLLDGAIHSLAGN
jgi:DNA-binding beta-propeller fold protein YncE